MFPAFRSEQPLFCGHISIYHSAARGVRKVASGWRRKLDLDPIRLKSENWIAGARLCKASSRVATFSATHTHPSAVCDRASLLFEVHEQATQFDGCRRASTLFAVYFSRSICFRVSLKQRAGAMQCYRWVLLDPVCSMESLSQEWGTCLTYQQCGIAFDAWMQSVMNL